MDVSNQMSAIIRNGGVRSLPTAAKEASIPSEMLKGLLDGNENKPAVIRGQNIGYKNGVVSPNPWDWDYTLDEAINRAWHADCYSFSSEDWRDSPTAGMSLKDYVAYRQETSINAQVNWEQLAGDLGLHRNMASGKETPILYDMAGSYSYTGEHNAFDYLAARYATAYTKLSEQYAGEELAEQVSRLDEIFNVALDRKAEEQSTLLSKGLAEYGIDTEKDAIKKSYIEAYNTSRDKYLDFVRENKGYADSDMGQNQWLRDDDRFMTASLQRAYSETNTIVPKSADADYSSKDLYALGVVLDELRRDYNASSFVDSEETIGIRIGQSALKVLDAFRDSGTRLGTLSEQLIGGYASRVMDKADQTIQNLRIEAEKRKDLPVDWRPVVDHSSEDFLNRKTVESILNIITSAYRRGAGMGDALKAGVEAAKESYKESQKSYTANLRYGSDTGDTMDQFIRNYFSIADSEKGYSSFTGRNRFQDVLYDWALFQRRLGGEVIAWQDLRGIDFRA